MEGVGNTRVREPTQKKIVHETSVFVLFLMAGRNGPLGGSGSSGPPPRRKWPHTNRSRCRDHPGRAILPGIDASLEIGRCPNKETTLSYGPVNLVEKLGRIQDYWNPRIIGELNGQHVKLAKVKGEFVWHFHQNEDELFLVLDGTLRLEFRDGELTLGPGEMYIVPRGVEHRPVAEEEVHLLMFEPASTLNTGNVENEKTVRDPQRM